MKNKKTLLVIGVAVLLVSVVGATFAFFNAQNATSQSIGAEVNTQTGDTSTFLVNGDLSFTADDTTFSESSGDKSTTATGRVVFRAGSENASGSDLCYTVKVNMTSNNFNYTNSSSYPELVLQAKYADVSRYTAVAPSLDIASNSLHEYASAIGTVPYVTVPIAASNQETGYVGRNAAISGYDVTTNTTTFYIPYASGNNVYKIHAAAGTTVEQDWIFKLNFINYEWNQADITNPNNNNNKTFNGQIVFESTTCPNYGDINGDGEINSTDLGLIDTDNKRSNLNASQIANADINGDSVVDAQDYSILKCYIENNLYQDLPNSHITNYKIYGDYNLNVGLDVGDYVGIDRYVTGYNTNISTQQMKNSDINNDGKVNYIDVNLSSLKMIGSATGGFCTPAAYKSYITFTINSVEYTAGERMNWGAWVDSDYNTIGATFHTEKDEDDEDVIYVCVNNHKIEYNNKYMINTKIISENGAYTISSELCE